MRLRFAMPSWVDKEGMDVALGKACWDMCDAGVGDERRVEMREMSMIIQLKSLSQGCRNRLRVYVERSGVDVGEKE